MSRITLVRLNALDRLTPAQLELQLDDILNLIGTATREQLTDYESRIRFYKGAHKNNLLNTANNRRANFLNIGKPFYNSSKPFIKPEKTNTHGNTPSLWRFLRFWDSSQHGQQQPKIQNKQQISQKTLQMKAKIQHQKETILQIQHQKKQTLQEKDQYLPAKNLRHSHSRPQGPTFDGLLQEQQQPLFYGVMDAVGQTNGSNSRAKQQKTWIDQENFSSKLKQD